MEGGVRITFLCGEGHGVGHGEGHGVGHGEGHGVGHGEGHGEYSRGGRVVVLVT